MVAPQPDNRSPQRRSQDERIAAEPSLAPLELPADAPAAALESHLPTQRHPVAVPGIVENGLVRPLDPGTKLQEHSRVIIVAAGGK